jgi:heme-degrading monooxygenase HmoA
MNKHLRIATYTINKGSFREVADLAQEGMLKTFKEQPGFIRYGVADIGDKSCMSITLWETHEQAEASVPTAATWVKENLGDKVELRSSYVGDLAFYEGARATV